MDDQELRQLLEGLRMPGSDRVWQRKLSERNNRYAALRELFEQALAAAPDDVNTTLDTLGVTVLDMQAAFDGLAMRYRYPDL